MTLDRTTEHYQDLIDRSAAKRGATGHVSLLLRGEAVATLIASCAAFEVLDGRWWWFFSLFLLPDLSMLGYLRGPRWGAILYNLGHNLLHPTIFVAAGLAAHKPNLVAIGLIWIAHIAFDRALGFGLKYPTAFGDTHLKQFGRAKLLGPN